MSSTPAFRNEHTIHEPEVIPREGTWQRQAYEHGRRFYGKPGPHADAMGQDGRPIAEAAEITPADISQPAMTGMVELGDNVAESNQT